MGDTRGLMWVKLEGSGGEIWSSTLQGNSGPELGVTSPSMPKASRHRVTHEHGHLFSLQTPCKDQARAESDGNAQLLGAELALSL